MRRYTTICNSPHPNKKSSLFLSMSLREMWYGKWLHWIPLVCKPPMRTLHLVKGQTTSWDMPKFNIQNGHRWPSWIYANISNCPIKTRCLLAFYLLLMILATEISHKILYTSAWGQAKMTFICRTILSAAWATSIWQVATNSRKYANVHRWSNWRIDGGSSVFACIMNYWCLVIKMQNVPKSDILRFGDILWQLAVTERSPKRKLSPVENVLGDILS